MWPPEDDELDGYASTGSNKYTNMSQLASEEAPNKPVESNEDDLTMSNFTYTRHNRFYGEIVIDHSPGPVRTLVTSGPADQVCAVYDQIVDHMGKCIKAQRTKAYKQAIAEAARQCLLDARKWADLAKTTDPEAREVLAELAGREFAAMRLHGFITSLADQENPHEEDA